MYVILYTFNLTFMGEFGDRSQITAIILSSVHNPVVVGLGTALGHLICTLTAIIGGYILKNKLSVRWINFMGGLAFLVFGVLIAVDL